jgi:EAL domain-containing protein (putative c-di-GMP-specific phosphodiesterase class I)
MHDELVDRLARESSLRAAVTGDELTSHYQPVLDMVSETPVGAEALVRWPRDGRLVPPAHFIPLAEETGLIVPLGRRVLERACLMLVTWRHAGLGVLSMSVNMSVRELESPTLVEELEELLTRTGVTPTQLILELTESALMHDVTTMSDRLTQLRQLGVRIAIDDFGTGFSSLSRLRWLPIDILKIDKSFVDEVDADDQGRAMVRTVIQLASALGLDVVAEGVERRSQRDALIELGCRFGQGYLFGRPMPAPALMELLDQGRLQRSARSLAGGRGSRVP